MEIFIFEKSLNFRYIVDLITDNGGDIRDDLK